MNPFRHTTPEQVRRNDSDYDPVMVNASLRDSKFSNEDDVSPNGFNVLRPYSNSGDDDDFSKPPYVDENGEFSIY